MINLADVTCGYGKRRVLSNVYVEIIPGQIMCILGRNGAGKTTLFKTIMGLLVPMEGVVTIDGLRPECYPPRELARRIGYVPQNPSMPFSLTVFDMVMMGSFAVYGDTAWGLPGRENRKRTQEALEIAGIEALSGAFFNEISGGEKRLAIIARALAQQPSIIAMDEPMAHLDPGNQIRLVQLLLQLRKRGIGILMNTHDPSMVLSIADRVVAIDKGRICAMGIPAEVLHSKLLSSIYDTDMHIAETYDGNGERQLICLSGFRTSAES